MAKYKISRRQGSKVKIAPFTISAATNGMALTKAINKVHASRLRRRMDTDKTDIRRNLKATKV